MAVESNVHALFIAKQSAKGTPAAAPATGTAGKRLRHVAGQLNIARADGQEDFSDLTRFGDSVDYVETLLGSGTPSIQFQPNEAAYLLYLFTGAETFTAKSVGVSPPKYVFEPGATTGFFATIFKRVGLTDIVRQKFNDCKITGIRIEGSTANKIVKIAPTILSLDPGEIIAADPTVTNSGQQPFQWTEAEGRIKLDGTVYRGQSQFAFVTDDAQSPIYGDSSAPYDLVAGNARVRLEAVTLVLDAASRERYFMHYYGKTTPVAGDKPIRTPSPLGSYEVEFIHGTLDARESLKIEVGAVRWTLDDPVNGNPAGGAIELAFAGGMRNNASGGAAPTPPLKYRVTVETGTGDSAAHS